MANERARRLRSNQTDAEKKLWWRLTHAAPCIRSRAGLFLQLVRCPVIQQGSQFTGQTFTGVLIKHGIAISMDGKGAWRDNVFVERLWRSVKCEEVYLRAYDSVSEARVSIGRYLDFNDSRPYATR
jgi:transposase InsO family protein